MRIYIYIVLFLLKIKIMGNSPIGCTACGCSTTQHVSIGGGTNHCYNCRRHCTWLFSSGAYYCRICDKYLKWFNLNKMK